tara:strand:+ start:49 stop:312 length:264 start_codon:yes stop_codon:yes gene_type:complete
MIGIIGMIVYCIICGALTNYIGNKKNMNNSFWWGFLLGILGLITVAGLPMQKEKAENESNTLDPTDIFLYVVTAAVIIIIGLAIYNA